VRLRVSVPLFEGELSPAYRWRLVTMLYAQQRPLLEGTVGTAAVIVVCLIRTHSPCFAVLAVACLAILFWRRAQYRSFRRVVWPEAPPDGAPDDWARRFAWGGRAAALVWACTSVCAAITARDGGLLIFVFMVQAGWLGGMAVRNAVSPACVATQVFITTAGICAAVVLAPMGLAWLALPFWLVYARALMGLGRQSGEDTVRMMRSEQELEAANRRLTELSQTDSLTLIGNRRAFDLRLQLEWARARRETSSLTLLMLDVDFFKLYNDRYGHPAGDACLVAIAAVIARSARRPADFAGRFGGEEFVALLPDTDETGACDVAERVHAAIRTLALPHEASPFRMVSASIGIASLMPQHREGAGALVENADRALYEAKNGGRNQTRTAYDRGSAEAWHGATPPDPVRVTSLAAMTPRAIASFDDH
jgi:diguanylate cyclase (GGDEF)-like protein